MYTIHIYKGRERNGEEEVFFLIEASLECGTGDHAQERGDG